ncbi:hypothetical protein M9458_027688, partial [Cirrhinus mrigala]
EAEAVYLKDKLYGSALTSRLGVPSAQRRRRERRSGEARRPATAPSASLAVGEQPAFFSTPPYSPTSSHSSDFLSDGYGAFEQLADGFCPSQAFPRPFADPFCAAPPVSLPDAHLVPVYGPVQDVCEGSSDCVLHPEDFDVFPLAHEAAPLTPEPSPTADGRFLYGETERAEIGTLACQIRSLASSFDAYGATHQPQPDGALCWPPAPEPLLDETVIDSILRELVSAKEPDCAWNRSGPRRLHQCVFGGERAPL